MLAIDWFFISHLTSRTETKLFHLLISASSHWEGGPHVAVALGLLTCTLPAAVTAPPISRCILLDGPVACIEVVQKFSSRSLQENKTDGHTAIDATDLWRSYNFIHVSMARFSVFRPMPFCKAIGFYQQYYYASSMKWALQVGYPSNFRIALQQSIF